MRGGKKGFERNDLRSCIEGEEKVLSPFHPRRESYNGERGESVGGK